MLWARTLERMAWSQERHLSYWAHPPPLRPEDWGWDLNLGNIETPLCNQCGPGGLQLKVVSCPYGVSSVGNVHHIQPCTTFPLDYLQECSQPGREEKDPIQIIKITRIILPNPQKRHPR